MTGVISGGRSDSSDSLKFTEKHLHILQEDTYKFYRKTLLKIIRKHFHSLQEKKKTFHNLHTKKYFH